MSAGFLTSQFVAENDWGSALIRYFTIGEISHVDLVLSTGELLGARFVGGVKIRPPNYGKFSRAIRLKVYVPDVDAALRAALDQIGKPYDTRALVDMAIHSLRPMPGQAPPRWYCSELNDWIVLQGGTNLLREAPDIVTPEAEMNSPLWIPV